MNEDTIEASTANFPFKQIKGKKGITFQQTRQRTGSKEGSALMIEHNGHDHVSLIFKELHETPSKNQGSRRLLRWTLDAKASVQLASVLFHIVENHMRDSAEEPYTMIVDKERAGFGVNWINEEYQTAISRTEKRKARSHLFGLMKRCIETCDDDQFINFLLLNLSLWADNGTDEFAIQQAEKAIFQLGLVPESELN